MKKSFYLIIAFLCIGAIGFAQHANRGIPAKTKPVPVAEKKVTSQVPVNINLEHAPRGVQSKSNIKKATSQDYVHPDLKHALPRQHSKPTSTKPDHIQAICTKNQAKINHLKSTNPEQYEIFLGDLKKIGMLEKELAYYKQSRQSKKIEFVQVRLDELKSVYNLK